MSKWPMDPTVRGSVAARSAAPWSPAPAPASSWHSTLTAPSPGWASRPSGEKFRVVLYPCSRGGVGKRIKNLFNLSFALYLFTWSLTEIFYSIALILFLYEKWSDVAAFNLRAAIFYFQISGFWITYTITLEVTGCRKMNFLKHICDCLLYIGINALTFAFCFLQID